MRRQFTALMPLLVLLASCSNAESEAPVDLQPGRYEVTISGIDGAAANKSICFDPDRAKNFASEPLKGLVSSTSNCTTKMDERKGNKLSGTRKCSASLDDGTEAKMIMHFDGRVAAESFAMDGDVGLISGGKKRDNQFHISGRRAHAGC